MKAANLRPTQVKNPATISHVLGFECLALEEFAASSVLFIQSGLEPGARQAPGNEKA